jgi:asparagine synthase (glutamine-hydrolysing)
MCGIAGLFNVSGLDTRDSTLVDAMCRRIAHRGPDDQGITSHRLGHIGMRRLAIIDLNSGHQPIANEDQTIWIVFNGEIYNFQALRQELERLGHRFSTRTDTECIVHAYEQYGTACFERLRGMFAVAILDLRQQRLVLARDRLGKKPLYYTTLDDGTLAFASELKCFFALPAFRPRISQEATQDFFALGYVPQPASIYEGVYKLPPAHVMIVDARHAEQQRYWQPVFEPKWREDEHSLQAQLLAQVEDAVRVRLVSDVPFGAFLSGGTDSSVVATLMARNMSQPVKTFSIGFSEAEFNELPDARRVAQHIGADHHELVVQADAAAMLGDLGAFFDEPFGDASAIPTYLVSQLAVGQVKMVLSGDGGDELFAGYGRYRKYQQLQRIRRASLGSAGSALATISRFAPGARAERLRRIGARLNQPWPDDYLDGVALSSHADLGLVLAAPDGVRDPYARIRAHFHDRDATDLDRVLRGDMATYLVDDVLVKVDRMSMANSLEVRSPLLDQELVHFAGRLPQHLKLQGADGKALFKRVARSLMPAEWVDKPKQGFAIPLAQWLRGPLRERLQDLLASQAFRQRSIYNHAGIHQMFREHMALRHDHSERLWLVMVYEAWAARMGSLGTVRG